jgi:hypothetical protein
MSKMVSLMLLAAGFIGAASADKPTFEIFFGSE